MPGAYRAVLQQRHLASAVLADATFPYPWFTYSHERHTGVEPAMPPWQGGVLPLHQWRVGRQVPVQCGTIWPRPRFSLGSKSLPLLCSPRERSVPATGLEPASSKLTTWGSTPLKLRKVDGPIPLVFRGYLRAASGWSCAGAGMCNAPRANNAWRPGILPW